FSKPAISPARTECFDIFSPPPGDRDVISQVDRLSSKETKTARRSVWIAVGAAARSTKTCMVVSRVGGFSDLTLSERRSLSRRHGISKRSMCRPTRPPNRGRLIRLGEMSEDYAQPLHRGTGGSMFTREAHPTTETPPRHPG